VRAGFRDGGARRGCHGEEGGAPWGWLHGTGAQSLGRCVLSRCGCLPRCCLGKKRKTKEKEEKEKKGKRKEKEKKKEKEIKEKMQNFFRN
jgi:hypothetical protein